MRSQIGLVTQETQVFAGIIKENIKHVKPCATDSEIIEALENAFASPLVHNSSNGIDTLIGENVMKLSGGEKQRLSIARSLIRNAALLIYDEATSSLDSLTEENITQTVKNISEKGEKIVILVAHRLSTIMHADVIYVLNEGRIVETGSHRQLIINQGFYY